MKIKITKEGPYLVSGHVPLKNAIIVADGNGDSIKWRDGKAYDIGATSTYALCRCGHSQNKPFCDGAHTHCQFHHEEMLQAISPKLYKGAVLDLVDEEQYCASLRFCDKEPGAWQATMDSDQPGYSEIAKQQCHNCASGRLVLKDKQGELIESTLPLEIGVIQDLPAGCRGPLWIKGGIPIEGADGILYRQRQRVTLCRCGESDNMPFCDTSHRDCPHMQGDDEN